MGLLKLLFGRRGKTSQSRIAGRAAAVIDHVIHDVGLDTLVNGTLVLDKQFRLRFIGASPVAERGIIATVNVSELAEARIFRELGRTVVLDVAMLKIHTGCLVYAVMREFRSQSPALRALP